MPDGVITCPKCGEQISLTSTLKAELEEKLRPQLTAQIGAAARKKAEKEVADKVAALENELSESEKINKAGKKAELQLLADKRKLAAERDSMQLEVARILDSERAVLREEIGELVGAEYKQKGLQKDKQMADMISQIADLKRRAEQGSQQLQGEVGELQLEQSLRDAFPTDTIEPVPTGIRGADLIQRVRDKGGRECGSIVWEVKQTKAWSDSWLPKLRNDLREIKGDVAILLSAVLPNGELSFCAREGVWVAHPNLALCLATLVRSGLENLLKANTAAVGKQDKADLVYTYVTGPEFRGRVEAIVEAWKSMTEDLDSEKRALNKIWSKREQHLQRALVSTASLYGSIHGVVSTLPEIEGLSLSMLEGEKPKIAALSQSTNSSLPT